MQAASWHHSERHFSKDSANDQWSELTCHDDFLCYASSEILREVSLSQINYNLTSFYTVLSLEPIGRHLVRVCEGTACYVRGGPRILDFLESKLEIKSGETTKDNKFTLETVNCLGCCALGPVIEIDKKYFGKLNSLTIEKLLATYD